MCGQFRLTLKYQIGVIARSQLHAKNYGFRKFPVSGADRRGDAAWRSVCSWSLRKSTKVEVIVQKDDDEGQTFFIIVSGTAHVCATAPKASKRFFATLKRLIFWRKLRFFTENRFLWVIAAEDCKVFHALIVSLF